MIQVLCDLKIGMGERCRLCQMNGVRFRLSPGVDQQHPAAGSWKRDRHGRAPKPRNKTDEVLGGGDNGRTVAGAHHGIDFAFSQETHGNTQGCPALLADRHRACLAHADHLGSVHHAN